MQVKSSRSKKKIKNYKLQRILGQGSFGKVYFSPPYYAIKQINLQGRQLEQKYFYTEIQILSKLRHKNVLFLYEHFQENSYIYTVTNYCGCNLNEYLINFQINKKRKFNEDDWKRIFQQICQGFQYLQSMKIVHRDIKLQNILINQYQQPVIADFGFSKLLLQQNQSTKENVDNKQNQLMKSQVGTYFYQSPQLKNKQNYTSKADIWSLGILYLRVLIFIDRDMVGFDRIPVSIQNIPQDISCFSRDLVIKMLKQDESDRISWKELFNQVLYNNKLKSFKSLKNLDQNETAPKNYGVFSKIKSTIKTKLNKGCFSMKNIQ